MAREVVGGEVREIWRAGGGASLFAAASRGLHLGRRVASGLEPEVGFCGLQSRAVAIASAAIEAATPIAVPVLDSVCEACGRSKACSAISSLQMFAA